MDEECETERKDPPCQSKGAPRSSYLPKIGSNLHIKRFIPALLRYGIAALITVFYMTEYKTLLQYLPFYNGKFYIEPSPPKKVVEVEEEQKK